MSKKPEISIFDPKFRGDFTLMVKEVEEGKTKYKDKESSPK